MKEGKIRVITVVDGRTEHELAIDALMPAAEMVARAKMKRNGKDFELRLGYGGKDYNHCFFSEYFNEAMTKMTVSAGLRCQ